MDPKEKQDMKTNEASVLKDVNTLLERLKAETRITTIDSLDDHFFLSLYHAIIGEPIEGSISDASLEDDKIFNCQLVIDNLANDILDFDLSHISGQDILSGNTLALGHLIEIFSGLYDLVSEEETNNYGVKVPEKSINESHDPDAFSQSHEILSDVFEQEFGSQSRASKDFPEKDDTSKVKEISWGHDDHMSIDSLERSIMKSTKHGIVQGLVRDVSSSHDSSVAGSTESLIREVEQLEKEMTRRQNAEEKNPTLSSSAVAKTSKPSGKYFNFQTSNASSSKSSEQSIRKDLPATTPIRMADLTTNATSTFGDDAHAAVDTAGISIAATAAVRPALPAAVNAQNFHTHTHIHYHQGVEDDQHSSGSSVITGSQSIREGLKAKSFRLQDMEETSTSRGMKQSKSVQFPSTSRSPEADAADSITDKKLSTLAELDRRLEILRESVSKIYKKHQNDDVSKSVDVAPGGEATTPAVTRDTEQNQTLLTKTMSSSSSDTEIEYLSGSGSPVRSVRSIIDRNHQKGILRHFAKGCSDSSSNSDDERKGATKRHGKIVRFKRTEDVKRDERLEALIKKLADEHRENLRDVANVKDVYQKQFGQLKQHRTKSKMEETKVEKQSFKKDKRKRSPTKKKSKQLCRVYGGLHRHKAEEKKRKPRKRSASASPVRKQTRGGRMILAEDDVLPVMSDEFPYLDVSPRTCRLLYQKQIAQIARLKNASRLGPQTKTQRQIQEAQEKQKSLVAIMKKDLEQTQRIRELRMKRQQETLVQRKLREKRMASARARRYYEEYQVQMRAKMQKRKYREEKVFKTLFEDALDIQKQRIRELRCFAREKREASARKQQDELDSLENYYRDRFLMLSEELAKEKQDMEIREKHEKKVMHGLRQEMRKRMEHDIKDLQEQLIRDKDSTYFRQLDADRLRKDFQLAKYRTR